MISVIVPVYNTRDYLCRCVDALLAQDHHDVEIILIDDGSTDGSDKLCDQLANDHAEIRVIHQTNAGLSAARNCGVKAAQGEYLTFVDSDDAVAVNFLSTLYSLIVEQNVEIAACTFAEITPRGEQRDFVASSHLVQILDPATCLQKMLLEQDGLSLSACARLYAKRLFKQVKFPVGKLYEDVGTTYKLVLASQRIAYLPQPLYYYYANSASIIHQEFSFAKHDLIELTDCACDDIVQQFPELRPITDLRRMHARFSILRQMVVVNKATRQKSKFQQTEQHIITYLRTHRADVLHNPYATLRDRMAMYSLLIGKTCFALCWQLYDVFKI